jgi:hypothetical protein
MRRCVEAKVSWQFEDSRMIGGMESNDSVALTASDRDIVERFPDSAMRVLRNAMQCRHFVSPGYKILNFC